LGWGGGGKRKVTQEKGEECKSIDVVVQPIKRAFGKARKERRFCVLAPDGEPSTKQNTGGGGRGGVWGEYHQRKGDTFSL